MDYFLLPECHFLDPISPGFDDLAGFSALAVPRFLTGGWPGALAGAVFSGAACALDFAGPRPLEPGFFAGLTAGFSKVAPFSNCRSAGCFSAGGLSFFTDARFLGAG